MSGLNHQPVHGKQTWQHQSTGNSILAQHAEQMFIKEAGPSATDKENKGPPANQQPCNGGWDGHDKRPVDEKQNMLLNNGVPVRLRVDRPGGGRSAAGRRSLTSQEDLQRLQLEFDTIQERLQQMPKREALPGIEEHPQPPLMPRPGASASLPAKQLPSVPSLLGDLSFGTSKPRQQQQHHPHADSMMPDAASTLLAGTGSLWQQLQPASAAAHSSMDSTSQSTSGNKPNELLFQFSLAAAVPNSMIVKCAREIFEDVELTRLCDDGLNKQLQRTKDGATDQSRIAELAALVKLLRKCVREMGSRASMFVDQCIKLEKDQCQQVETVQLSSDSSIKSLEAELAGAKRSLAQFEAAYKKDKAAWGAELEGQRGEVSRLSRELERMADERERARDEGKRAEQARQQLEVEIKDLRKQASQQMREVSVSQNKAVRSMAEEKLAAERREASFKEEAVRLQQHMEAAKQCIEALEQENAALQQVTESLRDGLRASTAGEEALGAQAAQLKQDLADCQQRLAAARQEVQQLQQQLHITQQQQELLQGQTRQQEQQLLGLQQHLAETRALLEVERASWQEDKQQLQAVHAQALEREGALAEEKGMLKTALAAALSQKETLEQQQHRLQQEKAALAADNNNLQHQVEFASGNQAEAQQQAAALQQRLSDEEAALTTARQELSDKDARLAHLEGEFTALKEVLGDCGQHDVVNNLLSKISTLQGAVAAAEAARRCMHNEIVELRGNIRVYCRVRPHGSSVVICSADQTSVQINVDGKEHSFAYDRVFGSVSTQAEVFSAVSELVQSALDGYHVCLFSYGQTGAGKTHTMQGSSSPEGRGIIPRAVDKILQAAAKLCEQDWEYSLEACCLEIYNNSLRDLLGDGSHINDQSAIKHDPAGGHTTVVGVRKVPVTDAASAQDLINQAAAARACQSTAMNASSSRSHSVFMLYITGHHAPSASRLQGCLCLVDLAGSERLDRSQAEDQRKKEACAINQSLSSLGDVFAALSSKSAHVPYRNSKLTYLLQPCLGGHGKTLMFVNINPEPASAFESLCSLKFAAKVNGCETGAKGGAKRNVVGPATASMSVATASGLGLSLDSKRLSLPGQPKSLLPGAAAPEPALKRMSMIGAPRVGSGASGAAAALKRPAAASGIPLANAAKKPRAA